MITGESRQEEVAGRSPVGLVAAAQEPSSESGVDGHGDATTIPERYDLEILTHIPADESLRASWNALVQQMSTPEVFYTYEWALAVQRSYAASLTPLIFLLREGGALAGVAVLATDSTGKDTFFLNAATADYCDF